MEEGRQRLQKILAAAGYGSRRSCEGIIQQGRVQVNGQVVTKLGTRADPNLDEISVDGKPISSPEEKIYLILNKPPGYISTVHDPGGRPTVLDLIPHQERLYPVGRLDAESEGLLLLTNDGELTHRLTHPRYEHEKEYLTLVKGRPKDAILSQLRRGVDLEEGRTAPARVSRVSRREGLETPPGTTWLRIVVHEGRKRQIRRMCAAVGHPVQRLIRVRMGPIELGDLPVGEYRPLSLKKVQRLQLPWPGKSKRKH
jgi:23S rRNA pseudouridine2605 synthase